MKPSLLFDKLNTSTTTSSLAIAAGFSGLIYLAIFTIPYPLTRYYNTIPPVDYTKLSGYSPGGFIAYMVGLGVLFALYIQALRLVMPEAGGAGPRRPQSERANAGARGPIEYVFIAAAVLGVILLFSYPLTAIDLFIYAIRTRGWALYGLNPLATAPGALPAADPWLGLAAEWGDAPSPYGPAWELVSLGAFYLSGGGFLGHLLALKVLALLAYLGSTWLVYLILKQLQPAWAIAGTLAFAWNPLALLESVQNGHNDILMTFFFLAAIWLHVKEVAGRPASSSPGGRPSMVSGHSLPLLICLLLALSILVKFMTILVVPFILLALAQRFPGWPARLAALLGYGLIIILVVVLAMLPWWPGWDRWAVLAAGSGAGRSLMAVLVLALRGPAGTSLAFDLARDLLYLIFGLIYLYYLWPLLKTFFQPPPLHPPALPAPAVGQVSQGGSTPPSFHPSILPSLHSSFFTFFWYILLAAPVFHAWYLLWFLPLAALLLPAPRALRAATVFSITALLIIPYFETIRVWYPALLDNPLLGHLVGVPLLIIPPVLALWWPIRPGTNSEVR